MLTKKSTVILCLLRLQELFDQHTAACTMQNWKYWVFSRVMQVIAQLLTPMETATPGPLKCLCAPRHQISAKSAPQKARNRNKARFATKLCKLSKDCANENNEE